MKIQYLAIMVSGITIALVMSISYLQIATLENQNKAIDETNQMLTANLTNYQNLFGTLSKNYTLAPFALKTQVYVAEQISTNPVTTVIVNHPYQVIANITKIENTQPIVHYYCLVQVTNSTGLDPHIGWGQGTLIPSQSSSQCAISWTPTVSGNYTISAFAWRSLFGSPWSESAVNNVKVVSSPDNNTIPVTYENKTFVNFPLDYKITGDNKVLGVNMTVHENSETIELSINALENGTLTVTVPKIMDDMIHDKSANLVVLIDGQEVNYNETQTKTHNITVSFPQGTRQILMITMVIV